MDILPLETQQQIFALACTDGGSTGNALSLTSKAIRETSRKTRFHTVYLVADNVCLEAFVALYDRELEKDCGDKPHIRHLFLRFPRKPALYGDKTYVKQQPSSAYLNAGQRLIHAAAPDLYSLVVHAPWWSPAHCLYFPILQRPFPLLREATFVNICDPRPFLSDRRADIPPLFPIVTHLYLLASGYDLALETWSIVAPNATHLRVTGISAGHVDQIANAVGARVNVDRAGGLYAAGVGQLAAPLTSLPPLPGAYPSLRYLCMELTPRSPSSAWSGTEDAIYAMALQGVLQIEEVCNEGSRVRAIVLPAWPESAYSEKYGDASVRAGWMARVEGREGYWEGISGSGE
ncbi:hypothetical protein C8Q79DRAFT_1013457 [Trametes meyenii]|nr:hypothetical protein C8Q79DRAFT_1013457 [Trametes meyenii]